jgi:hypothetical protein
VVLARVLERDHHKGDEESLFPGEGGGYLDGSALRRRFKAAQRRAGLRPIRLHDLCHSFGSLAGRMNVSTRELQGWMGHADAKTTARYTHYRSRGGEASRLAPAFQTAALQTELQASVVHEPAAAIRESAAVVGKRLLSLLFRGMRRKQCDLLGCLPCRGFESHHPLGESPRLGAFFVDGLAEVSRSLSGADSRVPKRQ